MDTKAMGQRIQRLRKEKGLTQEKVAEALDMSVNYLSNIERGRDVCSTALLIGIANLLDASMDYLLGDTLHYNRIQPVLGDQQTLLMHEIATMSEADCGHLRKYIQLLHEKEGE